MSESDALREFIRQITLRIERSMQMLVAEIREDRRQIRGDTAEIIAELRDQRAEMRDMRAEMQAQRAALFKMLDRLDDGGGAAPAG